MELNPNFTMLFLSHIIVNDKVISSSTGQGENESPGLVKEEK